MVRVNDNADFNKLFSRRERFDAYLRAVQATFFPGRLLRSQGLLIGQNLAMRQALLIAGYEVGIGGPAAMAAAVLGEQPTSLHAFEMVARAPVQRGLVRAHLGEQ